MWVVRIIECLRGSIVRYFGPVLLYFGPVLFREVHHTRNLHDRHYQGWHPLLPQLHLKSWFEGFHCSHLVVIIMLTNEPVAMFYPDVSFVFLVGIYLFIVFWYIVKVKSEL